jgi:hypothetical protein
MIQFADIEFDDYTEWLFGSIPAEDIIYGFMAERIQYQLLPGRKLDMCPRDLAQGFTLQGGYYQARRFRFEGKIIAATVAQFSLRLAALDALFTAGTKENLHIDCLDPTDLTLTWQALPGDRARVTPNGVITGVLEGGDPEVSCLWTPWWIEFTAPDPIAVSETITQNVTGASPFTW